MASTEEEGGEKHDETLVSIIVPIHNGSADVVECLQSVLDQTYQGRMQVCIVDDASTDSTPAVVEAFVAAHGGHPRVSFSVFRTPEGTPPGGPGFARNLAIRTLARGQWLCLLDADDVAFPERVETQLEHLRGLPEDDKKRTVVGSQFVRLPEDSTPKYTAWANGLTAEQLYSHRFRCITLIQPTWFMHRAVYDAVGGYEETYPAYPEDMRFF
ncbi:MAG: glycosyltransferase, partial [archaeon]|nr:glycosyltransferase [archaeon]